MCSDLCPCHTAALLLGGYTQIDEFSLNAVYRSQISSGEGSSSTDDLDYLPLFTDESLAAYLEGDGASWSSLTNSILQNGDGAFAGLAIDDE